MVLELQPISGNGTAVIKFSEALNIPDMLWKRFNKTTNTTSEDFGYVNLDAIMEFHLYQLDTEKDEDLKSEFYTLLKNWTSDEMVILFNFTKPMEISSG